MHSLSAVAEKWRLLAVACVVSSALAGFTGCGTRPLYPPKLKPEERAEVINGITNLALAHLPNPPGTDRAVGILTEPIIQLPETEAGWEQQEYSIYVRANHPAYSRTSIHSLLKLGLLQLDFTGASLKPRDARAGNPKKATADLQKLGLSAKEAEDDVSNGRVLELVVRAGEIRGPIRIAAWFPAEYRLAAAYGRGKANSTNRSSARTGESTWADQKLISIRSGDLTTNIEIVDQLEARAAFGDEFPRHFYIGRVYLQNTNSTKKLIVYTTSMRVPVYLYRRSEPIYIEPASTKSTKPAGSTGAKRPSLPPKSPAPAYHPFCGPDAPCQQRRPADNAAGNTFPFEPVSIIAYLIGDIEAFATKTTPVVLTTKDPAFEAVRTSLRAWLADELKSLKTRQTDIAKKVTATAKPAVDSSAPQTVRDAIDAIWTQLHTGTAPIEASFEAFSIAANKLGSTSAAPLIDQARALADLRLALADLELQIAYLDPAPGTAQANRTLAARIFSRAIAVGLLEPGNAASPFSQTPGLSAGIVDNTSVIADPRQSTRRVLFSQNPEEQRCLDHLGYLWRDTNRPLTFQAVLKTLILTQNQAARTKWVRSFDLLGRVAGGLVSLSPLVEEFGRQGYTRAVAFYASVITPELGALLLEDLNAHIRNLGEMSMDTVMVIQPRSVVDRYVFFPRGPIYNHPDEFDQHSPAYIVKVLSDDVSVKAELVEQNVTVNGAGAGEALAQEARNTGTASAAAALARQAQTRSQAANGELALTLGKIEKLLLARKEAATDAKARADAEAEIRRLIREFQVAYPKIGDTAFASLLGQYGMKADDLAPSLDAPPALRLIAGTVSAPHPLPVKDDRTTLAALVIKATVTGEKVTWTSKPSADGTALSYTIDSDGASLDGKPEEKRTIAITIHDQSENLTSAEQSLTLVPLTPVFAPDKGTFTDDALTVPYNDWCTLTISAPLHDSAPENWTLELTHTDNLKIRPARVPLNLSAPTQLSATVSIDPSGLKDANGNTQTGKLTAIFRQGTRVIFSKEIPVAVTP